jgi:hypothetical protein
MSTIIGARSTGAGRKRDGPDNKKKKKKANKKDGFKKGMMKARLSSR